MKDLPPALIDLLDAGTVAIRALLMLRLGAGPLGLWNGTGPLVVPDTMAGAGGYRPGGVLRVDDISGGIGQGAAAFTVDLAPTLAEDAAADRLAAIEAEDYKGRPVEVLDAFFDPATRALLHVEPMLIGLIDVIEHQTDAGEASLTVRCETLALENHRDGFRTASHEDQQLIAPGDRGFEHASTVASETLYFGRSS